MVKFEQGAKLNNYQIIRLLGEGGMGEVWLARDILLERDVAIKCLNPLLTRDQEFSERFLREARIQAKLTHSNIVGLHAFFEAEGHYYMVLEYAPGVTLRNLIDKTGPIPEKRTLAIFNQILSALDYAHSKGIVHRDVKPANIMIDTACNDAVKVMDFGIARLMDDVHITRTGTRLGTISYMSPEQVRAAKDIDQRSDIYSAGIILYEMLSGRLPFEADTDSEYDVQHKIVTEPVPDPRKVYPYIGDTSISLLLRMTQKERDRRPQSIAELLSASTAGNRNQDYIAPVKSPMISPNLDEHSKYEKSETYKYGGIFILILVVFVIIGILTIEPFGCSKEDEYVEETTETVVDSAAAVFDTVWYPYYYPDYDAIVDTAMVNATEAF